MLFFVIFTLVACKHSSEKKEAFQTWVGKKLVLPNDSSKINFSENHVDPLLKPLKILTVIDANCGCCISELNKWADYIKEVDTSKVGFVFLLHSIDNLITFEEMNQTNINFSYPVFYDKGKYIFSKNKFPDDKLYQTFYLTLQTMF